MYNPFSSFLFFILFIGGFDLRIHRRFSVVTKTFQYSYVLYKITTRNIFEKEKCLRLFTSYAT